MFHVNDAVKLDNFEVVHVVSGDIDVFVSLMYRYLIVEEIRSTTDMGASHRERFSCPRSCGKPF